MTVLPRIETEIEGFNMPIANRLQLGLSSGSEAPASSSLTVLAAGTRVNDLLARENAGQIDCNNEPPLPAYAFVAYACHWQAVGACRVIDRLQIFDPEACQAVGVFLLAGMIVVGVIMNTRTTDSRAWLVLRGPA